MEGTREFKYNPCVFGLRKQMTVGAILGIGMTEKRVLVRSEWMGREKLQEFHLRPLFNKQMDLSSRQLDIKV